MNAALALVAASVYFYVGRQLQLRPVSPEFRLPATLFSVWWYCVGAVAVVGALTLTLGYLGIRDVALYLALSHMSILLICVALWSLLYYLVFLFTGRSSHLWPLTAFYALYALLLVYAIYSLQPVGVEVEAWRVRIIYAQAMGTPFIRAILVFLFVPQIAAALTYSTLFFRAQDRTARYRIVLVSGAIVLWFGSSLAAAVSGLGAHLWWQLASRGIGLAAALVILAAYRPPKLVRQWLHVTRLGDDTRPTPTGG